MKQVVIMAAMMALSACSAEAQNEVTVADFLMSPTEVSQQEYEAVMGSNPSNRKGIYIVNGEKRIIE